MSRATAAPPYGTLDEQLRRREAYYPSRREPEWSSLQSTLGSVVDQLWETADAAPPCRPTEHLEALGERPVFVVGYYKSGTTLLLNLLDGHPELLALPGEWRYFTHIAAQHVHAKPRIRALHARAIRNVITPYGIPPRWLLGNPANTHADPYDEFGRMVVGFARARGSRDVLAAAAQALAAVLGAPARLWIEKTPTQEFHLEPILKAYPEARFVHILREPHTTIGSIKAYDSDRPIEGLLTGAAELGRSFRRALDARRRLRDRYTLVKYEDLVTDTATTMRAVAEALGITYSEAHLLVPTTLGAPATANAGQPDRRVAGEVHTLSLGRATPAPVRERLVVDALVGPSATLLGYEVGGGSRLVELAARAALFARHRIAPVLRVPRSP